MGKRALANQEQAMQSERLKRFARSLLLLLATVLSLGTVGLLAADQLYRPDAFMIDQLKIKGRFQHLDPQQVEGVVRAHEIGNFFSIELSEIELQVEKLAWVQNAEVRREWPNTLLIQVQEQQPVMRWGSDAWVNTKGDVVELPGSPSIAAVVILEGHPRDAKAMLTQSLKWQTKLANSGLTLVGMRLSESHAYQLELREAGRKDSFNIQLGRREVAARLDRFLMLYDTQLSAQDKAIQRVDARYPDGLAIRATEVAKVATNKTSLKEATDNE